MDGISVVVHMVRCASSLLICDTIPTHHLRFPDVEVCRGEAARVIEAERDPASSDVWMAKCRYQMAAPAARPLHSNQVTSDFVAGSARRAP